MLRAAEQAGVSVPRGDPPTNDTSHSATRGKGQRLPREERMKGYKEVQMIHYDYFFDRFPADTTPVAVEVRASAEPLHSFVHPDNALYVFGPEDGSIPKALLSHCHRFLVI